MKSSKGISKKSKTMDYTNYAYNEAVGRLKMMLADNSYAAPKGIGGGGGSAYLRSYNEDSGDNFSDNMSVIDRPVLSDISKYLTPSQKARMGGGYRPKKCYGYSTSKENLTTPALYQSSIAATAPATPQIDYRAALPATESVHAPVEIFNFIEKQEDYIEQLEKESKYCRSELTNLLGKVKDVINENEQLTENARNELTGGGGGGSGHVEKHKANISPSSDSDEQQLQYGTGKKSSAPGTPRKKEPIVKSPRYGANAPNIVYEARISELEAELMQANIDLKRVRTENEELNRKLAHAEPSHGALVPLGGVNCETHRKQIEHLQKDKMALEETVRHLQKLLDSAKSEQYSNNSSSKRYINELVQMERSQAELEVKHLRDELDRQHERVRELQHEMARRLADERANAERRYNTQVDQLGGDLSSQWEQVAKLQLDLERQKRYESDMKRDVANRNAQIEELKMELRSNRSTFLADMAQANAEKQSLEQELNSLRLQLDRAARESKTEAARLNAEINSLRQRLDRGDADLLHSKREVLRLNDEISNLEKELAYGELKNEIRPTKKDLDKRISEMQDKHEHQDKTNLHKSPEQLKEAEKSEKQMTANQKLPNKARMKPMEIEVNENANACISPIDEKPLADEPLQQPKSVDISVDSGDEILKNIIKSNERLEMELAKIPPLPELSTYTQSGVDEVKQVKETYSKLGTTTTAKCPCQRTQKLLNHYEHLYQRNRHSLSNPSLNQTSASKTINNNHTHGANEKSACCCCTTATMCSEENQQQQQQQYCHATTPYTQTHTSAEMHCHAHELTLDTHYKHILQQPQHTSKRAREKTHSMQQQQQQHQQKQKEQKSKQDQTKATKNTRQYTSKVDSNTNYDFYNRTTKTKACDLTCDRPHIEHTSTNQVHHCHVPKVGNRFEATCPALQCKTEPLPWLQQHLVLNQTFSACSGTTPPTASSMTSTTSGQANAACQSTCQTELLTMHTDCAATCEPQTAALLPSPSPPTTIAKDEMPKSCRSKRAAALTATLKPKHYFEQLLHKERSSCHKTLRPRPPVKVDVNVRLVPKQKTSNSKATRATAKAIKASSVELNETFVKELDEVAHALNETFVKEPSEEERADDEEAAAVALANETFVKLEDDNDEETMAEALEEDSIETATKF